MFSGSVDDGQCYNHQPLISYLHQVTIVYHKVQVNIVCVQVLQRSLDPFGHDMMPSIVQLCGQPYLFPGNPGVFNALPNLLLVAICQCGVDVTVAFLQRDFDRVADFVGRALPGAETNGWDFIASIEGKGLPEGGEN